MQVHKVYFLYMIKNEIYKPLVVTHAEKKKLRLLLDDHLVSTMMERIILYW